MDPLLKTVFCVGMMAAAVCSARPLVGLELAGVMFIWSVAAERVPAGKYFRRFLPPLGFLALSALVLLWEYAGTKEGVVSISVGAGYLCITETSFWKTALVTARALGAVSALFALGMTMTMTELTGVLKRLRCPELLCSLMYLMYRYIFLMYQAHRNMKHAAKSRLGYRTYQTSLRTTAAIYGNLLAYSYRQASANFDAMESRCFSGNLSFLALSYPWKAPQVITMALLLAAELAVCIVYR